MSDESTVTESADTEQKTQKKALFNFGTIVSTPGILEKIDTDYMMRCLRRHLTGDWGCCCLEDKAANENAVKLGARILSSYPIDPSKPCKGFGENTLWIITEGDRSVTTLLLPEEY